ncbi:MAG: Arginine-tRNA ligase [Parcubacteria group bacterium GW2011_GWA2_47_64]|nr:MAG: Arginine-tRNA ligase [Parcubacteria group bacterium GW2011_GWA2_47_64]KKU95653.1 MAG: Arginine-tRNA ligase [Parcubacteria group bacterium GW2011_GWC2_48_17]
MIVEDLQRKVTAVLEGIGVKTPEVDFEHPADLAHGDYSTNVALVYAKELKMKPRELAEKIVHILHNSKFIIHELGQIEVAGAGFINFYLSPKFFAESVAEILGKAENFGRNESRRGEKVMVEYTDPNPFKEFHIGHLMSNAVGESIARLFEFSGAKVVRACWQGDVGLHVAKAVWGILKNNFQFSIFNFQKDAIALLGQAYTTGARAYEADEKAKKEIEELNRKIFEKSDPEINKLYDEGRKISLAHFEEIYKKLGTKFDYYFFESQEGREGEKIVTEFLKKGVFEKSENAVIFRGEKFGLHTRVFITSQGLPTYETKELGLNKAKFAKEPDLSQSIIITANEQNDYFKVVLKAMEEIYPEIAKKTKHISHGMMRFASGKMSSRTGNIITGESLITAMENLVMEKIKDRELPTEEKQKIAEAVAVGAIKYSILRAGIGSDIIYDFEKSISFEGDSGPYLEYTYARVRSVLRKANVKEGLAFLSLRKAKPSLGLSGGLVAERLLYRFPEVVERAAKEFEPHYVATYLIELSAAFNNFYARNKIIGSEEENYRLALTRAVSIILKNGLYLLGIEAPERM